VRSSGRIPRVRLPFPSILVTASWERATAFATAYGSRVVALEGSGHINADAGLGPWPEGRRLLAYLVAG